MLFSKKKPVVDPLYSWSESKLIEAVNSFSYEKQIFGESYRYIFQLKELIKSGHRPLYDEIRKYSKLVDKNSSLWFVIRGNIIEKHDSKKPIEKIEKLPFKITWCKFPR